MKKIILGLSVLFTLWACQEKFTLPDPIDNQTSFTPGGIVEISSPNEKSTSVFNNRELVFKLTLNKPVQELTSVELQNDTELDKIVADYNTFKSVKDFKLLPKQYFQYQSEDITPGGKTSQINVTFNDFDNIPMGSYLLPISVKINKVTYLHVVSIYKDDTSYVPLSDENKKPMPPGTSSCPDRKEPMKMVAYVETNDWDIRNLGQILLSNSNKPVFDIVVLFAANMNYDTKTGKRVLFFNDKLQPIIKDPIKYIKPLKDRGIKVLIDILPNHQGVGYANFQNYEEALDFAKQCKYYADYLGIDGWDIDEEYAGYHNLPEKPQKGVQSFFWFMRAMKEVMPDKMLTLYDYAHPINASSRDAETQQTASDLLDYSWANYGEDHGSFAGLPNSRYGKKSIEANWGLRRAEANARANVNGCFGLFMFFNINGQQIRNRSAITQLSKATQVLYGENCKFTGIYHKGPKDR